ncbi:helix-turn-helix domain-containing protein [Dermabacter hominis]|uniref:helix-turn-helix domain-containing protein n=1 Tax=Dermabacter hominis TaxID=36740 RepID=UPI002A3DAE4B|nr:helix-turn-helix domain-containing protein [Dermabacter hominis]
MIDAQTIIRAINRADTARDYLRETYLPGSRTGGPRAQNAAPPAPLDIGKLDQINLITQQLAGWARLIEEETREFIDAEVETYLRRHATFAAAQEWALDMIEELNISAAKGAVMAGASVKRTPAGECACGERRWVYHADRPYVKCRAGHESTPADHLASGATLSISDAARALGVSQSTITRAVQAGRLDGVLPGSGGKRGVVSVEALKKYAATRGKELHA